MKLSQFVAELQRRHVYKVAAAYGVVSWLLVQIATQVFPFFDIPSWVVRLVVVLVVIGFPIAVVLAWAYELTPEGIQRTDVAPVPPARRHKMRRRVNFGIAAVLISLGAVLLLAQLYKRERIDAEQSAAKSVAVLPFLDLSEGRNQEYFSDGVTEQIIDALAHIRGLSVVARTTAFVFKNKGADLREVGRQLHVTHVVEGSVSHGVGKVRVVAQLIDVANGFHLWSETYDSSEQDLLTLQSDVARKVASALQLRLHLGSAEMQKPITHDAEAADLYLRGRYLLNKRAADSIQRGLAFFEQAVAKDPQFALGQAGIADAYILLAKVGAISANDASAKASPAVTKALNIDPNLAEGYVSRATLLTDFEWNWRAAEVDFRKAIALQPSNANGRHWYARHLAELGRFDEAVREIEAAEKLDPLSPLVLAAKGKIFLAAHRFPDALAAARRAIDLEPAFTQAWSISAQAHALQLQYEEGITAARRYVELSNGSGYARLELAYALAVAGRSAESQQIVQEVTNGATPYSPYDMATICAAAGDAAGAADWLGRALDQRSVDVVWIRVDPRLDRVRGDARLSAVVRRMQPAR